MKVKLTQQKLVPVSCAALAVHSLLAGCPVHTQDAIADVTVLPQTGPHGYYSASFGWGKCNET